MREARVANQKYVAIFRAGHPGWLRCSSLKYSRYSRSSRLAIRAPRSGKFGNVFLVRDTRTLLTAAAFVAALVVTALPAAAQTGRVGGSVKDEKGQPIKGATVVAENPNASPSSFTATTDDKGRYSIIGLRSGPWKITASAPGFQSFGGTVPIRTIGAPNPPVDFTLLPGATGAPPGLPKEIVAEVEAAEAKYQAKDYDAAIALYSALLAKAPKLTRLNVAIARSHRAKKDYKTAAEWYDKAIAADPNDNSGRTELAMMYMEQGQLDVAREKLLAVAETLGATREVFYSLGEIERARDKADDAAKWYQRAADADANWAKPHVGLALVAIQKGDIPTAIRHLEKAMTTGTDAADQAMAKAMLDQLKK